MHLGYNTNGLAHHEPLAAIELLAELGYQSVALTIDHDLLNPYRPGLPEQSAAIRKALAKHRMRSVMETGARYLLDPRQKHEPTLVSADRTARARRIEFLHRAIDLAAELESDCVSFWSGVLRDEAPAEEAFARLVEGLEQTIEYAGRRGVMLGFEPEPGMFIDTMSRYQELLDRIDAPHYRLTLDIGHLHCLGETPLADYIARWGSRLVNVHLEDMRAGVHEHLMFGEGEIDFPPIFAALRATGYRGGVHVELSRHSHEGPSAARRAMEFLAPLL
jgi:sugar phosphate isomerase/epimerase